MEEYYQSRDSSWLVDPKVFDDLKDICHSISFPPINDSQDCTEHCTPCDSVTS